MASSQLKSLNYSKPTFCPIILCRLEAPNGSNGGSKRHIWRLQTVRLEPLNDLICAGYNYEFLRNEILTGKVV